jgi:hypothetical protein
MKYFLSICIVFFLKGVASSEGIGDKYPLITDNMYDIISHSNNNDKNTTLNGHKIKLSYRELFFKLLQHRCPIH